MIVTPADTWGDLRAPSNDERRAAWAAKYYRAGLHHRPELSNTTINSLLRTATKESEHETK